MKAFAQEPSRPWNQPNRGGSMRPILLSRIALAASFLAGALFVSCTSAPRIVCSAIAPEREAAGLCSHKAAAKCKGPITADIIGAPGDTVTATCGAVTATCTIAPGGTYCSARKPGPAHKSGPWSCVGPPRVPGTGYSCTFRDP